MTHILVLFLFIEALVVVAKANNAATLATPTAPIPSSNVQQDAAEAPQIKVRRLGKHQHKFITGSSDAPCLSPSEAPLAMDNMNYSEGVRSLNQENATTQAQHVKIKKENHHHPVDKSVAGGGVILGGLATTFFVAIACYIRATRRKNAEPTSSTSATSQTSPASATSPTSSKV